MKTKPKLLVIVDNPEQFSYINNFGYDAFFLPPSKEPMEVIKSKNVSYDIVILDVAVSFVSGWEVLKYLRNNAPFELIPILVVTDLKEKTDELLALRSGADDFIKKPVDVDILLARIDVALRRSMWNKQAYVSLKELPFLDLSREVGSLTGREELVLKRLAEGLSNDEIAKTLCLSNLTVKTHVKNIFKKLHVNNRTEAILVGLNLGLIK